MDQQFQTSFIPKKPVMESRATVSKASVSFFMIFATIVLVVAAVMLGGAYIYKIGQAKTRDSIQKYIVEKTNQIKAEEPTLREITRIDKRLSAADAVVANHVLVSPIFNRLQQLTLKSIQFTKFEFSNGKDTSSTTEVKMSGRANSYAAIANESDILTGANGTDTYFLNPIFSNLSLDDKARVAFDLTFRVDPDLVSYVDTLKRLRATISTTP